MAIRMARKSESMIYHSQPPTPAPRHPACHTLMRRRRRARHVRLVRAVRRSCTPTGQFRPRLVGVRMIRLVRMPHSTPHHSRQLTPAPRRPACHTWMRCCRRTRRVCPVRAVWPSCTPTGQFRWVLRTIRMVRMPQSTPHYCQQLTPAPRGPACRECMPRRRHARHVRLVSAVRPSCTPTLRFLRQFLRP